ncbi:MAG: Cold shock protein of CSP family, partial [uncultured Rubrobacteraceae bacterium]
CPKERSSGSTTRRATALSPPMKVAKTSSYTTAGYQAAGSGPSRKAPRSPTRQPVAKRACRRKTSAPS